MTPATREEVLTLHRYFQIVPLAADDVYLYRPTHPSFRVTLPGFDVVGLVERLQHGLRRDEVERLDGGDPVLGRFLRELVTDLLGGGALSWVAMDTEASAAELHRFERQLSYLAAFETATVSRYALHRRLRDASVLMLGLGGLGGWALQHLVAFGVGSITGVDHDIVESSNLARQSLFSEADLGAAKVDAAARAVAARSSFVRFVGLRREITSSDDIVALLTSTPFDLVVLTADRPVWRISRWAAEAAQHTGVPLLRGNSLGIGPLTVPGESACPACAWPRLLAEVPEAERILELQRRVEGGPASAISTEIAVVGALLADEAFSFLSGARPVRTLNSQIRVSMDQPALSIEPFPRRADCPVCAPGAFAGAVA